MKIENNFEVNVKDGQVELVQNVVRVFDISQAMVELGKLKNEFVQLEQQLKQTEDAIATNQLENKRDALLETKGKIGGLIADMELKTQSGKEDLMKELRTKIKVAKADIGYSRIRSADQKIVKQNAILGPILAEKGMDVTHPMVRELKIAFEEI